MKDAIYNNLKNSISGETKENIIRYYQYMLDNNPVSTVYPKELRELHKGLIIGLKFKGCNK